MEKERAGKIKTPNFTFLGVKLGVDFAKYL
jgi:hypothetical protein